MARTMASCWFMSGTHTYSLRATWSSGRKVCHGASPMPSTVAPSSRSRTANRV
jgi:hypothetical protein